MSKALKIIFGTIGALLLLLVAALAIAATLFDPNDYRDRIGAEVEKFTGRSFSIDGDLSMRIFPWLAVSAEDMTLGNAEGFGPEPFAVVQRAAIGIELLPLLLRREVVVDDITLNGLALELAVDANGRNNWDDLAAAMEASAEEAPAEPTEDAPMPISNLDIAGVALRDASIRFHDAASGQTHHVEKFNLSTGRLRIGSPVMVSADAHYRGGEPELAAELQFSGVVDARLDTAHYTVRQIALNLIASGDAIPAGRQSLSLTGTLNYDANDGHMSFADGRMQAAGITSDINAEGSGLNSDAPQFSGTFRAREFSPRAVAKTLAIDLPPMQDRNVLSTASLESRFTATTKSAAIPELVIKLDDTTVNGSAEITDFATQRIIFDLRADRFNADRYTPADSAVAREDDQPAPAGDINAIRIPVELLDTVNARGTIAITELKAQGLRLNDVVLRIDAPKGQPKNQQLTARLYGGDIQLSNRVVPGATPQYSTQFQVNSVVAGDLLRDFLGRDLAEGIANLSVDLNSRGATVGDIRSGLNGTVTARLTDGAVKGFNVAQTLREAKARYTGDRAAADSAPQQTDFASLNATARITNGVLEIENLDGRNPLLRLLAGGQVNLVEETLDVLARPTIVRALTGQEGAGLEELAGLEIPIRVRGSWADPRVRVDLETVLRDQAAGRLREAAAPHEAEARERLKKEEERISRKLEERVGEGASDALRSLFGRGSSRQRDEPTDDEKAAEKGASETGTEAEEEAKEESAADAAEAENGA